MPEPTEPGQPTPPQPEQPKPANTPTQASESFLERHSNRYKSAVATGAGFISGAATAGVSLVPDQKGLLIGIALGAAGSAVLVISGQNPK